MWDELEQLRKLTRNIELEATDKSEEHEKEEAEDLGALVIDSNMGNEPYDPDEKVKAFVVKGSSANITDQQQKAAQPIFEEPDEVNDDEVNKVVEAGIGSLNIGRCLKNGLRECGELGMNFTDCPTEYNVGDFVSARHGVKPVILIVKCSDGDNILTAKPTNNMDEYCEGNCGCWPEFSFSPDEISPMDDIKLSDIFDVMKFNDSQNQTESFNGGSYDESPMKDAQEGALKAQRAYKCNGCEDCKDGEFKANFDYKKMNEFLDDICGPVRDYTAKSPLTVKKNPDGSTTASQSSISVKAW